MIKVHALRRKFPGAICAWHILHRLDHVHDLTITIVTLLATLVASSLKIPRLRRRNFLWIQSLVKLGLGYAPARIPFIKLTLVLISTISATITTRWELTPWLSGVACRTAPQ
jgi:hypothetical protein